MTIRAVTFDFWDTIVDDNSDEAVRSAKGLRSKHDERRHLMWQALNSIEETDLERVVQAYDVADAAFNVVWKENHINWTVDQRMRVILNGMGRTLPDDVMARLIDDTGNMEVEIPPNAIEGIGEALAELATRYKLSIVSDSIVTPGTGLRQILDNHGLKQYFSGFAYSDEVGHSKPHRSMFDSAAKQLDVDVSEIVHIGDRDHNDVKGPHAIGAKAVLFTATRAGDRDITTADAICDHPRDLPGIIDELAAKE